MRRIRTPLLLATLLSLASALPSHADLLLATHTRHVADPAQGDRHGRIWLDAKRLRLEFVGESTGPGVATVIYRGDRDLYWALDPANTSYVQIDLAEVEQLGRRVKAARLEMAARLEQLPPDQRAAVERMMADMQPPEPADIPEALVATDVTRDFDGLTGRLHRMSIGDRVVGEIWTTDWQAVGVKRRDFRAFKSLAAFQRALLRSLGAAAGAAFGAAPFEVFDQLDGFPLMIRRLHDGAVESETRFERPRHVEDDASRYEVPDGWARLPGPGTPAPLSSE